MFPLYIFYTCSGTYRTYIVACNLLHLDIPTFPVCPMANQPKANDFPLLMPAYHY